MISEPDISLGRLKTSPDHNAKRDSLHSAAEEDGDFDNEQAEKHDSLDEDREMREAQALLDDDEAQRDVVAMLRGIGDEKRGLAGDKGVKGLSPVTLGAIWVGLSITFVLFNKYIFHDLFFPFPIFLTWTHSIIAFMVTRITKLIPYRPIQYDTSRITWPIWTRSILPIALCYTASFILSNFAYNRLSVPCLQMLRAVTPLSTLVIQYTVKLRGYNHLTTLTVVTITFGYMIAVSGGLEVSILGLLTQSAAVLIESTRLVLLQRTFEIYGIEPLETIAMTAPICIFTIGAYAIPNKIYMPLVLLYRVGWTKLLVNGLLAFTLEMAGLSLISLLGGLILPLMGVIVEFLITMISAFSRDTTMSIHHMTGYIIALSGLAFMYNTASDPNQTSSHQYHLAQIASPFLNWIAEKKRTSSRQFTLVVVGLSILSFIILASLVAAKSMYQTNDDETVIMLDDVA